MKQPALNTLPYRLFFLAALAAVLLLAACGGADREGAGAETPAEPVPGGTVVIGTISDLESWNEYVCRQGFTVGLLRRVFLPLALEGGEQREGDDRFVPGLAESWSFSEDRTKLTFRLRNAVWSDGVPVTPDDVVFTWEAQTSPDVAWIASTTKGRITAVEPVDDRSVRFRFDGPYPGQLADAVTGGILPRHVFGTVPFADWTTHDWSGIRIGSGPFVPDTHRPGTEIVLARNDSYFRDDRPRVDRVVARIVPDQGNLRTQLAAGDVDFLDRVPPEDAGRMRERGLQLLPYDYPKYDYIGWNELRSPFDDAEVRRALTMAIDREAIVEDLLYGYGRVSVGPVPSFWQGADPSLKPWPYDPERAAEILAAKGWTPGEDGILRRNGKRFAFELTTNTGNTLRNAVLVKVQEQLRRAGIEANVRPMDMRAWVERNMSGDFDAYVGGWVLSGKVEIASLFGEKAVPPDGANVVHYRSDELERELRLLEQAEDWPVLDPVLRRVQEILHRDQPYTFLYEVQQIAAASPRLREVRIPAPSDPYAFLEDVWIAP